MRDWFTLPAAVLGLALAGPGGAQAQPALPVAQPIPAAAPLPRNTVRCVYDYMSSEDREMALLLFAREALDGGRFRKSSRNVQVVDRLLEEAHEKCLARFNWSIARSDAALGFALTSILAEGLLQALDSYGLPVGQLDSFYSLNRLELAGKSELTLVDKARLSNYLKQQGWNLEGKGDLGLAEAYVESILIRDKAQRQFAASSGTGRAAARARPSRARTARRGRP